MSMFPNSRNVVITGQNVTMNAYSTSQAADRGFDILCQNASPTALHGSSTTSKDPGCLPGTRINVREHIFKWLDDLEGEVAMWMYGPAGIGKTAIAQTIAKSCEDGERLLSAFFFFRSDDGRNNAKHLVATLAFEMVQQQPHTHDIVCVPIGRNPLVFSSTLERQIKTIIRPALLHQTTTSQGSPRGTMLIIIDGLDECHDTGTQQLIIQSFVSLLASTTTPIRHKLLIVSRPESHIVSTFSAANIRSHVRHLCLDEWNSIADIKTYLHTELDAVKQTHPLKSYLDAEWPSWYSFRKLLDKSFESFAYATSAVRYISSHDRHPETSLNHLLDLTPGCAYKAHAELDALYCHILDSLDEETRLTVLKFLCLCRLRKLASKPIEKISAILGEETYVLELALKKISSVIRFDSHSRCWSYYHTSFADFLVDKQRSGGFYIYSPVVATIVSEVLVSELYIELYNANNEVVLVLSEFRNEPVEMQIHLLKAFHPSRLQTPKSIGLYTAYFNKFCYAIERGSRLRDGPEPLNLQFDHSFDELATWLRSYIVPWNLSTFLSIVVGLKNTPPQEHLKPNFTLVSHCLLRQMVKLSNNPGGTICHFFPTEETCNFSIQMVEIYLNARHRERDMEYFDQHDAERQPLHILAKHVLQLMPISAEICRMLEKCIVDAARIRDSSTLRSPQELIQHYLCEEDSWSFCGCADIATCMDLYIRKAHSKLDLPYVSEDVKELYLRCMEEDPGESDTADSEESVGEAGPAWEPTSRWRAREIW